MNPMAVPIGEDPRYAERNAAYAAYSAAGREAARAIGRWNNARQWLDAGHDAAHDAGGHDARRDAGRHYAGHYAGHGAGHDAGHDAGCDAGHDAGHNRPAGADAGHGPPVFGPPNGRRLAAQVKIGGIVYQGKQWYMRLTHVCPCCERGNQQLMPIEHEAKPDQIIIDLFEVNWVHRNWNDTVRWALMFMCTNKECCAEYELRGESLVSTMFDPPMESHGPPHN